MRLDGIFALLLVYLFASAVATSDGTATTGTDVEGNSVQYTVEEAAKCIDTGDLGGLREYINHGGNPNGSGRFPLVLMAARGKFTDGLRLLVEAGADVNVVEPDNWSALTFCSFFGNEECLGILMRKKANPTIIAKRAQLLPYSFAINNKHKEVGKVLADYTARYALENNMAELLMRLAKEKVADMSVRSSHGFTPLLLQCAGGHLANVKELIEKHGANYNENENDGWNCLTFGAFSGRMDMVSYLVALPEIDLGLALVKAAANRQQDAYDVILAYQNAREFRRRKIGGPGEPISQPAAVPAEDDRRQALEQVQAEKAALAAAARSYLAANNREAGKDKEAEPVATATPDIAKIEQVAIAEPVVQRSNESRTIATKVSNENAETAAKIAAISSDAIAGATAATKPKKSLFGWLFGRK